MKVLPIANHNFLRINPISQINSNKYEKEKNNLSFGHIPSNKTAFAKEIAEQGDVLEKIINKFFNNGKKISGINIKWLKQDLDKSSAINIVASGSSKNAGEMAKSFIEKTTNLPVNIMSASEFISSSPKLGKNDVMIFVSQSGNTADTLNALNYSKAKGLKTVAITNNPDSKIHKAADFALDMEAGVENAVAATKTVTSSVLNLWGIGMKLGEIKESFALTLGEGMTYVEALKELPQKIKKMVRDTFAVDKIADKVANKENFYFLAKEPNLGAVNEGALKLTETTQKRIISGASGEFMHGLFTSMQPKDVFIQVATGTKNSKAYNLAVENFTEIVKKRNIETPILIKSANNKNIEKELSNADFIEIPETKEEFTPLLTTIRFQQLTNSITKKLGINPDNGAGILTKFRENLTM